MTYSFADCTLDIAQHQLTRGGAPVAVEPQVFDLLVLLVSHAGELMSRDQIIEHVWQGRIVSDSAISARIAAARRAVGDDGKAQAIIRTVARRGLQFVAEVHTKPGQAEPAPPTPSTKPRVRYTKADDGRMLAYSVSGNGPPLLRMGYFATNLETEWTIPTIRTQVETFSAHHRLARYDELGCGLSDRTACNTDLALNAAELRAVADAAGFERFALFSESGGGLIAATFAALYPDRLTHLVISGGYVDGRVRREQQAQPDAIRALIAQGWSGQQPGLGRAFLLTYCPEGPLEEVVRIVDMMQGSVDKDVMLCKRDAVNIASTAEYLPRIICPTLIIHARHDGVHPLSEAQKLAAGIADAQMVVFDSANHLPVIGHETFDPYMQTILDFLAE